MIKAKIYIMIALTAFVFAMPVILPSVVSAKPCPTALGLVDLPSCGETSQDTDRRITTALTVIYAIAGFVSILFMIIGSFKFMIEGDNPESVAKARKTIIYSLVGLVVTISAWAVTDFILDALS